MDTSDKYCQMCEQAREIQTETFRLLMPDDFIALKRNKRISTIWREERKVLTTELYSDIYIWLPQQDQLQDMIDCPGTLNKLAWFWEWDDESDLGKIFGFKDTDDLRFSEDISFEMLWLLFVMYRNFNKEWNNEHTAWVNIDVRVDADD